MKSIQVRQLGVALIVCGANAVTGWADEPPPPAPTPRAVLQMAPVVQAPSVAPLQAPAVPTATPVQAPIGTVTRLPPPAFKFAPPANSWQAVVNGMKAGRYGPPLPALQGFVDLHSHPMSFLGFGGKLMYGAADTGGILPPAPNCAPPVALTQLDALGHENDWYGPPGPGFPLAPGTSRCGNLIRFGAIQAIEGALGAAFYPPPAYMPPLSGPGLWTTWPAWNDVLRQKMWIDWVQRAYRGGLRVMVALAVNNRLLGDVVLGGNSLSDLPTGDAQSADIQLIELANYVNRHNTWMTLVHNSTELYNAVSSGKLAVIAGVEIDNIGGLLGPVPGPALNGAIDHLYALGVRYIFPVHLVDNPIGKTAAYEDMFMIANPYEELGQTMHLSCAPDINYNYSSASARVAALLNSGVFNGWQVPSPVICGPGMGNVNAADHDASGGVIGLTPAGRQAIQHMMDLGMLIDVDHMSQASVDQTLAMAQAALPTQYPMMSGHNNLRGSAGPGSFKERQLTQPQYKIIGALHGMAGIGGAQATADQWMATLSLTAAAMGISGMPGVAFGTDADGMEFMMPPRQGSAVNPAVALPPPGVPLPLSQDGTKTWDYNHDGVAHYGLLPDYLNDVGSLPNGGAGVVRQMFGGAQYLYETWFIAERDKKL